MEWAMLRDAEHPVRKFKRILEENMSRIPPDVYSLLRDWFDDHVHTLWASVVIEHVSDIPEERKQRIREAQTPELLGMLRDEIEPFLFSSVRKVKGGGEAITKEVTLIVNKGPQYERSRH